jgi:hypothetical protein
MKKIYLPCLLVLAACGGIKRDYDVIDMSSSSRPDWLDSEYIAELNAKGDGYKYYVGENDNAASAATKGLCRSAAEAKARYDLAAAIETTVKNAYSEIESSGEQLAVKSSSDLDRALIVDRAVSGAEKYKDYWEQRGHKKEKGAAKDYKSYHCMTLVRISNDTYADVIRNASDKMIDSFKSPDAEPRAVSKFKAELAEKAAAAPLPAPKLEE